MPPDREPLSQAFCRDCESDAVRHGWTSLRGNHDYTSKIHTFTCEFSPNFSSMNTVKSDVIYDLHAVVYGTRKRNVRTLSVRTIYSVVLQAPTYGLRVHCYMIRFKKIKLINSPNSDVVCHGQRKNDYHLTATTMLTAPSRGLVRVGCICRDVFSTYIDYFEYIESVCFFYRFLLFKLLSSMSFGFFSSYK